MTSGITKVTVLGLGVLGSQIAFQTAFKGFEVTGYDVSDEALVAARERLDRLIRVYAEQPGGGEGAAQAARESITLVTDLKEAVAAADLVIEAVPELRPVKLDVFRSIARHAPEHTIFATNTSSMLPSDLKKATGRPDRFLALHFANGIWAANTAEIMGHPGTDPAVVERVVQFAEEIGMVPIQLHKEKDGYVLNTMLNALNGAAFSLVLGGYAEIEDVDKTWRIATGAPLGPFQILDVVGLRTCYNVTKANPVNPAAQYLAAWLKKNYIDKGKLGLETGEGFYKYH